MIRERIAHLTEPSTDSASEKRKHHNGHVRRLTGILIIPAAVCWGFAGCSDNNTSGGGARAGGGGDTSLSGAAGDSGPSGTAGSIEAGGAATEPGTAGDSAGGSGEGGDGSADPQATRSFIGTQVGGIAKLTVPPDDESMPVPADDPKRPGRYKTT